MAAVLAFPASSVAAYTLRFSPNPTPSGAIVTATLDYYDAYGCMPAALKRVQGPAGVVRLELQAGNCGADQVPANPNQSVSIALGPFEPGEYPVEVVIRHHSRGDPPLASATLRVYPPPVCIPDTHRLCLQEGRFEVAAEWRDFAGNTGAAVAVPRDPQNPGGLDSGFFWFFDPDNLELLVKVLDGCGFNSRFWVFVSPASTVQLEVRVTDVKTLQSRVYAQELGEIPGLTADTDGFPCL